MDNCNVQECACPSSERKERWARLAEMVELKQGAQFDVKLLFQQTHSGPREDWSEAVADRNFALYCSNDHPWQKLASDFVRL